MVRKKKHKNKLHIQQKVFFILCVIVLLLGTANIVKAKGLLIPSQDGVQIIDNTIQLDSLSLEAKIAQMVIVAGQSYNMQAYKRMGIGGIHLFAKENEEVFSNSISQFQEGIQIPFMVTADLEGCHNPFSHFKEFVASFDTQTIEQAYTKGIEEGEFLTSLGFTLNFAPVVDLDDQIWRCRNFPGSEQEVAQLAHSYVEGLEETGIISTAKHYPGQTLTTIDPHKFIVGAQIHAVDVYPYTYLNDIVDSIMVSHIITTGVVDSQGIPSVASSSVIRDLKRNFNGLIISDEINMLGLKDFYPTLDDMYIAVFLAGNDIVLNFAEDPNEIHRMILVIASAVEEGIISADQINTSVAKILEAKGFVVE